ncbi:hypothetical protein CHS0354_019839 [Potamilus streckersoni]|uniref:Uncharacterized protein n=1 Tax=Potamilus streckersoni TaxID=2493646 RepID=A0AAE0SYG4_9BIVA|nr:hypothetical protein CHS0354_019839 [Potamilus streckersoni]
MITCLRLTRLEPRRPSKTTILNNAFTRRIFGPTPSQLEYSKEQLEWKHLAMQMRSRRWRWLGHVCLAPIALPRIAF